jgi:hypothetical protein
VPVLAAILFIGVFPKPFLDKIEPAATHSATCLRAGAPRPAPASVTPPARCRIQGGDGVASAGGP